jgi:hypothetical protein
MMLLRKNLMLVLAMLLVLTVIGCSGGATSPQNDGGNPDDTNGQARISGSVTDNGTPVEGVEVAVYDVASGSLVANDTTSVDGVYKVNPLGGQYIIVAVGENFYGDPQYINLSDDGTGHKLDFAMKGFPNGMKGFAFCRITNEKDNTPIPNAKVRCEGVEFKTDAWGFCLMVGIPEKSECRCDVEARGFNNSVFQIRRNQFDRNLILSAEMFKMTATSTIGASIGGVVRDIASGDSLAGVFITIEKPLSDFTPITAMTNLGGVYRFYNLEKGTYTITAVRTGFEDDSQQVVINDESGFYNVFLTPNADQFASLSGVVYDATGTMPLPAVTIVLSNPIFGVKQETTSDSLGKFEFTQAVFGDYFIYATPVNPLFVSQGVAITLDEETQIMQFNLAFNESGALMGEINITNTCVDPPQSGPPTGAKVTAEKIGDPMSGLKFESNVDAKGQWAVNGVMAGTYLLKIEAVYAGDYKFEITEDAVPVSTGAVTVRDFDEDACF